MDSAAATPTDADLLSAWLSSGREASFHDLVARYAGLVRMAAWRTCGDDSLAAEATQLVFILLVRKAGSLTNRKSLAGWLHLSAIKQTKNLVRQQRREIQKRQQLHAAMEPEPDPLRDPWREMSPVLDEAMASLAVKDREALLLRFYRSLSVRETASVLGIATDAAQKRIDRATARLRGQLARRGCQAGGGSLAAVLLAGFAGDSQAAVPGAAILSSKALSVGAAAAPTGHLLFTLTTALKTSSLILPLAALLLAAGWLVPKYRALSAAEKENALLIQQIATASRPVPAGPGSAVANRSGKSTVDSVDGFESMDWKTLAAVLADQGSSVELSLRQARAAMEVKARIPGMSKDELIRALEDVMAFSKKLDDIRCGKLMGDLGSLLLEPLAQMDPPYALKQYLPYLKDGGRFYSFTGPLMDVFGNWMKSDAAAAAEWLDARVAAGDFDGKSLKPGSSRNIFEFQLMEELLESNSAEADRRLSTLSPDLRSRLLKNLTGKVGKANPVAYARLMREHLPLEEQPEAIAGLVGALRGNNQFADIDPILAAIGGTPEDRRACVESEAKSFVNRQVFPDFGRNGVKKIENLGDLRPWLIAQAQDEADRITGLALGDVLKEPGQMGFGEIAALAGIYDRESGGSEVLASFLECAADSSHKEEARVMAASLGDEDARARVLEKLK